MASEKVELASEAWVTLAEKYLHEHVPRLGAAVQHVSFSMCEVFTSAPAHLSDDEGRAAWWFTVTGPAATVGRGVRDIVDVRVDVDYESALPLARLTYDVDDAGATRDGPAREAMGGAAADALESLPTELRVCLTGLHNFLAPRTT